MKNSNSIWQNVLIVSRTMTYDVIPSLTTWYWTRTSTRVSCGRTEFLTEWSIRWNMPRHLYMTILTYSIYLDLMSRGNAISNPQWHGLNGSSLYRFMLVILSLWLVLVPLSIQEAKPLGIQCIRTPFIKPPCRVSIISCFFTVNTNMEEQTNTWVATVHICLTPEHQHFNRRFGGSLAYICSTTSRLTKYLDGKWPCWNPMIFGKKYHLRCGLDIIFIMLLYLPISRTGTVYYEWYEKLPMNMTMSHSNWILTPRMWK